MKKMQLKLDELAVESFATDRDDEQARGTVHGHASLGGQCSYNPCTERITCPCSIGTNCSCTNCFNTACEDLC